jgi:pilus assembly protein CpaF
VREPVAPPAPVAAAPAAQAREPSALRTPASQPVPARADTAAPRPAPVAVPSPPPAGPGPAGLAHGAHAAAAREAPRATLRSFDAVPAPAEARPPTLELVRELHDRVAAQLDLARVPIDKLSEEALWQRAETAVCDLVEQLEADGTLPAGVDQDVLIKDALNELLGLGPLEDLLADDEVTDVVVDRPDLILVERGGRLVSAERAFSSDAALRKAIDRLLAPAGRKLDAATPLVDARVPGGARVVAALPPVAVRGACLTVRKPRPAAASLDELARAGALSAQMAQFLATAVAARRNIVVCGGAGSGKHVALAALAAAVPAGERVVTVEEVAELAVARDHWVALEARLPEEGRGGISLGEVVRGALRMRPDRLVVSEVRGAEALEVLSALGAHAEGGMISVGGDSAAAALARLESLARLAAPEASARGLRELVAHAAHVVVTVSRFADGVRRVVSIGEVTGPQGEGYAVRELFTFQVQGQGEGGVRGRFAGTGIVPRFYEVLQARGEPADASVFR